MSGFRLLQNKGSTFTELINKMEITNLKQMTKEEVFNLIRQRLSFGDELQQQLRHVDKDKFMKEHRRFENRQEDGNKNTIFISAPPFQPVSREHMNSPQNRGSV